MIVFVLCPMSGIVVDVVVYVQVFLIVSYHMVIVSPLPDVMTNFMITVSFE